MEVLLEPADGHVADDHEAVAVEQLVELVSHLLDALLELLRGHFFQFSLALSKSFVFLQS